MTIVQAGKQHLSTMAKLFVEEYRNEDLPDWSVQDAQAHLEQLVRQNPSVCFVVLDNNMCVGGVFCEIKLEATGKFINIDTIQVVKSHRNKGIAKELMQKLFTVAKEQNYRGVQLLADQTKDFPYQWYIELGFEPTSWIELSKEFSGN